MQSNESPVTAVLVHGAWADGSSWAKVIAGLDQAGIRSVAAQLPLTSLTADTAIVRALVERQPGPVVLVGHSYGSAVATAAAAGSGKVQALVCIAGIVPDAGETVGALFQRAPMHPAAPVLAPDGAGLLWVDEEAFARAIAPDASPAEHAMLAAVQKPISLQCLGEPTGKAGWRERPSYFLIAEKDRMVAPDTQRFLAQRMGSKTVSRAVDHTPLLSAPREVVELIVEATHHMEGVQP